MKGMASQYYTHTELFHYIKYPPYLFLYILISLFPFTLKEISVSLFHFNFTLTLFLSGVSSSILWIWLRNLDSYFGIYVCTTCKSVLWHLASTIMSSIKFANKLIFQEACKLLKLIWWQNVIIYFSLKNLHSYNKINTDQTVTSAARCTEW